MNDYHDLYNMLGYDPYKGMNDDEKIKIVCAKVIGTVVGVIIALVVCALLFGCTTTRYVPVTEHHTDTLLCYSSIRDSIYLHDSIRVSEKGDTIRIERWRTRYIERTTHDTIYQARHDSIRVPYPVEKEVPAQLTWWQQTRMHVGGIMIWLLVFVAIIYVGKKLLQKVNSMP